MVLGFKDSSGNFRPTGQASNGIFRNQVNPNTVVLPSSEKSKKRLLKFVDRKIEEHSENAKINEARLNNNHTSEGEKRKIVEENLEERLLHDKLKIVLENNVSNQFLYQQLLDFEKTNKKNLAGETNDILEGEIKRLESELKHEQKTIKEEQAKNRESGSDVLFPGGSSNPNTSNEQKFKELRHMESRNEIEKKAISEKEGHLKNQDEEMQLKGKKIEEREKSLKRELNDLDRKSDDLGSQKKLIEKSDLERSEKNMQRKSIERNMETINERRKNVENNIKDIGEKQVLLSLTGTVG